MLQFVPVTDEIIFDHPEALPERLVPFSLDYPCHHGLAAEESSNEEHDDEA